MNDKAEKVCMLRKEYITLSVGKHTGTGASSKKTKKEYPKG